MKPTVQLSGTDGNVFALSGKVAQALRDAGAPEKASEMCNRLLTCASYDEALQLFMEYADVR